MSNNLGATENNKTNAAYYQSNDGFVSQVSLVPPVISHEGKQQSEARPSEHYLLMPLFLGDSQVGEDRCSWTTSAHRGLQMEGP